VGHLPATQTTGGISKLLFETMHQLNAEIIATARSQTLRLLIESGGCHRNIATVSIAYG
jgi:hypothetical protein